MWFGRSFVRRAARILLGLVLCSTAWWGWIRKQAPRHATALFELDEILPERWGGDPIIVACSNVAHGRGLEEQHFFGGNVEAQRSRLSILVDAVRQHSVDVLVLNEVDFDASWSGRADQARWLAREAGYRFVVEHRHVDFGVPGYRLRFGNAVLSRFPLEILATVRFPVHRPMEHLLAGSKQGVLVRVALSAERSFVLSPIHLDNRAPEVRLKSVQRLVSAASSYAEPTIFAGDFNSTRVAWPGDGRKHREQTAVEWLFREGGYTGVPAGEPVAADLTFRADAPNRVIDWVLHDDGFATVNRRALPLLFSDHSPVVASLRFMLED